MAIIDSNAIQYDGYTDDVLNMSSMKEKWQSFGWDVLEVDGHDLEQLLNAYMQRTDRPIVIIANTVKGKGISFMENNILWHYRTPQGEEYDAALKELEA